MGVRLYPGQKFGDLTHRVILEEKITPFIFDKAQQGDDQHNVALWYKKI